MKSKVVRLMDGMERTRQDCYSHALFIRQEADLAVVVTEEGGQIWWPMCRVMDDATEEESAEFYVELTKSRAKQVAEYKENKI